MEKTDNKRHMIGIYLRGVAMGAADVVPGVSGGTVAFITGIYEELLASIKSITPAVLMLAIRQGPQAAWKAINGNFLLLLVLGIMTSVLSLARIISYLLAEHPLLVWSFFFGLIAASSVHMLKQIQKWQPTTLIVIVIGALAAFAVAELKPAELSPDLLTFFVAGCIAICAMILPGISGSFILVLMGMYGHVLSALKDIQLAFVAVFAAGCATGLLSFSHLLSWLFKRYHDLTMALLTGFLVGSLNLVWPWKQVLSYYQNSKGKQLALEQANVLPWHYQAEMNANPETIFCLVLILLGFFIVFLLEKTGEKLS